MDVDEIARLRGWQYLDGTAAKEMRRKAGVKAYALDRLAADVFGTPDGKRLLRWMVQQTVLQPTFTGSSTQFQAGIREGQNNLVRQLLAMIERAKKGPPQ